MAQIIGFYTHLLVMVTIIAVVSVKSFQIPNALKAILNWKPSWINPKRDDHAVVLDYVKSETDFTKAADTHNSIFPPKVAPPPFLNLQPSWIPPEIDENSILHHDLYWETQFKPPDRVPQHSSLSVYFNSQFAHPVIPAVIPTQPYGESLADENDLYYDSEHGIENHDVLCLHDIAKPLAFVFLPFAALVLSLNAANLFFQRKNYVPASTITAISTTTMTTGSTSISIQYSTEVSISTTVSTTTYVSTETFMSISTSLAISTETITERSTSTSISTTTVTPPTVTISETSTKTDTVSVTETSVSVSVTTTPTTLTEFSTTTLLSTSTVTTTVTTPSLTISVSISTIMPNTVSTTITQFSSQTVTSTITSTTTSTLTTTQTSSSTSYIYQSCCVCDVPDCYCGGLPYCQARRRKRKNFDDPILPTKADSLPIQPTMAPVNIPSLQLMTEFSSFLIK